MIWKNLFKIAEKTGDISKLQFKHVLEDEGILLEKTEFEMLFKEIDAKNTKHITIKDFFSFIQHGDEEIDAMAKKVRRKIQVCPSFRKRFAKRF